MRISDWSSDVCSSDLEIVLSPNAKGLTTGEISARFAEIYGASVSEETISRITDKVIEEVQDWSARPLDEVYAAIFIDAIVVKVQDRKSDGKGKSVSERVVLGGRRIFKKKKNAK